MEKRRLAISQKMSSKIHSPDGTTLYLSGLPSYQLGTDYIADSPAYIFANHCIIPPGTIQCHELHLHAASIAVAGPNVILSSSGTDGVQNDKVNDNSANATNASPIWLSTARFQLPYSVELDATGGNGGKGFSPPDGSLDPGTGGYAGNGANITAVIETEYDIIADKALAIINDTRTLDQKIENMLDWAQLAQTVTALKKDDSISWVYTMQIDQSQPDMDPTGPLPHKINASTFLGLMSGTVDTLRATAADFMARIDCSSGKPGHGGINAATGKYGPDGNEGKSGTLSYGLYNAATILKSTEMLFHPDQISQTIRDIENNYFIGSTTSIKDARVKLDVLLDRLSWLPKVEASDPIYQTYLANEYNTLAVMNGVVQNTSAAIQTLKFNYQLAQQYKLRIDQGYDFYRHTAIWVPRASYKFYSVQLDDILADFQVIEKNYNDYQAAAVTDSDRKLEVENALAAARSGIILATKDIKILSQELTDSAATIIILQADVPRKKKAVDDKLVELGDKIKTSTRWPTAKEFFGAASQMAFCASPEQAAAMGTIQAGSLINSSLTEVTDSHGNPVDKGYVVDKIRSLKEGLDGLKEAVEYNANNPSLNFDDPAATKLLGQEDDIMDIISQYRDALGGDVDDFKKLMDDYIRVVLQRNNEVINYNSIISLYIQTRAKLDSFKHDEAYLASEDERLINSNIPALANTVKSIYLDHTAKVLELLYDTQRALMFWSLDSGTFDLSILRDQGFPSKGLGASLKTAKDAIIKDFADATNAFGLLRQPFGVTEGPNGRAIVIELNKWQLQQLRTEPSSAQGEYFATIQVVPATATMSDTESPFATMADVRIATVRAYIEGAKTGDGILNLTLQQIGDEKIVTVHNEVRHFVHDRLAFAFDYEIASRTIVRDGNIAKDEETYALVGPFATWRVGASVMGNTGLDMSGVTRAFFEFSGWSRSYH